MKKLKPNSGCDTKSEHGNEIGNNSSCFVSFLPTVLLLKIFFRLPISNIMSCKLVCKEWWKLLSHESNYSSNNTTQVVPFTHFLHPVTPRGFPSYKYCKNLCLVEISNDHGNNSCIQTPIHPKLPKTKLSGFKFIGSSNGLICIRMRESKFDKVYVCNPLNGDYIPLPLHEPRSRKYDAPVYKFCFVPSTRNFKVLSITSTKRFGHGEGGICEIFTVGVDDRWRRLTIPYDEYKYFEPTCCVSFNGALHWIVRLQGEDPYLIRTFDLATETTGQIPLQPGMLMQYGVALRLFNNQLSLVSNLYRSQFVIWTMKEYGNVESWTRDEIKKGWFPYGMRSKALYPVQGLPSGDILFARNTDLISCNVEDRKCSRIVEVVDVGNGRYNGNGLYGMEAYTPSFLSLNELRRSGMWEA